MGRKGLFSSAAAGVSLVAASLVLVIGVSALIGFRGFKSARETPTSQRVVLRAPVAEREAAGAATAPVVIGGKRKASRSSSRTPARTTRRARTTSSTRTETTKAPARSGLSAAAKKPAPAAPAGEPATPDTPDAPATKAPPATPVDQAVDDVGKVVDEVKPVESVGDVLLDLRDALP